MRHTVRIEQRSTVKDDVGEPQSTWTLFASQRAALERQTGRELVASEQRQGRVPTVFRLRWIEGVTPAMRLVHAEKVFDVESAIDPDGLKRELVITAVEHVEESG